MPRILVSDPIAESGIERLRLAGDVDVKLGLSPAELVTVIGDYDALAVRSETKVTSDVLMAASRLRIIGRAGVGVDNIDVQKATERGIVVVNSPEGNTLAAAELTFSLILALARNISPADASMRAGRWDRKKYLGIEVYGKTLGVIGFGKIGMEVASRAAAFGMKILAYDPYASADRAREIGAEIVELDKIYTDSDFITLHVPMNDNTRGMIGAEQIAKMKDGVRIVNCARGGLIDEQALTDGLVAGKVGGAGVDVFTSEPVKPENPLLTAPNTVLTPHLGASTEEAQVNVAIDIADQIAEVLAGRPARAAVNMPSMSAVDLAVAKPYIELGEKIGSLHAQLARELNGESLHIDQVEVSFQGDFGNVRQGTVVRSVMAGLLGSILSESVNLVNAPLLAASRNVKVVESSSHTTGEYQAELVVKVTHGKGSRTISGVVFGDSDIRIVHIDEYRVDLTPLGAMILTRHTDKPGIIGAVGTLLGKNAINIAGMNVGRKAIGGQALMALLVDEEIDSALMTEIRGISGMETAQLVRL
ncbi:MAG: phosphoglycerate dehydrogenase [Chthonomonadales bacterium]